MSYFVSILRGVRDIFFIKLFSSVVLINLEIFLNYIKVREIYIYIYIYVERERERGFVDKYFVVKNLFCVCDYWQGDPTQ